MDSRRLIAALESSVRKVNGVRARPASIFNQDPFVSSKVLDDLEKCIREEDDLKMFDGRPWFLLRSGRVLEPRNLATWLVRRAYNKQATDEKTGSKIVVEELQRFVDADRIPISYVALLDGVEPEPTYRLSEDLSITQVSKIAIPETVYRVLGSNHKPRPSAAVLVREAVLFKESNAGSESSYDQLFTQAELFQDACRALTLAKDSSPALVALWEQTEDFVPCGDHLSDQCFSWPRQTPPLNSVPFRPEDLNLARDIYGRYLDLPAKLKSTLRLSIDRLNSASGRGRIEDIAIDLGIAFEVFFFHDRNGGQGELTFTLAMRAAHFLEKDSRARRNLTNIVKGVYHLRSKAVHAGRIELAKKVYGKAPLSLFSAGRNLMARALTKTIMQGKMPDWEMIVLE